MKLRTEGPSLSRKNVAKALNVTKKMSEVRSLIPAPRPWISSLPDVVVPLFALSVTPEVPFAPVSLTQPWILSTASFSDFLISDDCSTIPPTTIRKMTMPSAISPSRTIAAPAGRGIRCCCIFVTRGPATVARIAPTMTGIVIVEVRPRSQVRPDEQDRHPDEEPREQARGRAATSVPRTHARGNVASISTTVRSGVSGSGSAVGA